MFVAVDRIILLYGVSKRFAVWAFTSYVAGVRRIGLSSHPRHRGLGPNGLGR